MVLSIIMLVFGVFCLTINEVFMTVFGVFIALVSISWFYREYMKLKRREPQIILNNKGIKTITTKFYKWEEIDDVKFTVYSKSAFLTYKHPKGMERIHISDFDIRGNKLRKLGRVNTNFVF